MTQIRQRYVWTAKHPGLHPVPAHSVVIARGRLEAKDLVLAAIRAEGIAADSEDVELDLLCMAYNTVKSAVRVLSNGDY